MSEAPDPKKTIKLAVDNAAKVKKPKPKAKPAGGDGGGSGGAGFYGPPSLLPDDAPVKCLGKNKNTYYFLDSIGQLIALKASEIGRLNIISLFGGETYLRKVFPQYKPMVDKATGLVTWAESGNWQHGIVGGILIDTCTKKGQWDPLENERGPGCWEEGDTLIMHCGDVLYVNKDRIGTGLRGSLLYPRGSRTLEPIFDSAAGPLGPAGILLDKACSWNWERGETDAKLWVGLIGCQLLGAAAPWRAQCWVTGPSAAGKSTLQLLTRWLHGSHGIIKAENATPAGVAQAVGFSSLPVSLDELEASADNRTVQETIELIRIAASGGGRLRGGTDGTPTRTQLLNCFIASSVLMPPLLEQDKSRMAILNLRKYVKREREPGEDELAPLVVADPEADEHIVLGKRDSWERIGRCLRGRLIEQWPRYKRTLRAFRGGLIRVGHGDRAADQFGAIGAAFDCLMFDGFDSVRAERWGEMLPPMIVEETAQTVSGPRQCLNYLLEYLPDIFRSGARQSVAHWILAAKDEILNGNSNGEASETLAKFGLRVYRGVHSYEAAKASKKLGEVIDAGCYQFFLDVSHTAKALLEIYKGTQWQGRPGAASGTWAQDLKRLPMAIYFHDRRRWIGKVQYQATTLPFETVFPPMEKGDEDDIAPPDRVRDS